MEFIRKNYIGILACFGIAVPAWLLGKAFPIIGGPVLSILFGMLIALFWSDKGKAAAGSNGHPKSFCRQRWYCWDSV